MAMSFPELDVRQVLSLNFQSLTSGDITMIFGDLNAYKIRRAGAVRVVRLDERYAELGQVAFDVHIRQDGRLLNAGTAPVKSMVQV